MTNLLDATSDNVPRFITKKWIEVHDQSGSAEDRYKPRKQIRFKTSMLRSDFCDFSDACIVGKRDFVVTLTKDADRGFIDIRNRSLALKKTASFTNCISNIKYLDVVMPMYNLLECSKNYSKTTGSLRNYYRDEPNNPPTINYDADPITNSAAFE